MEVFKRSVFVFLALHAVVDLTLAVLMYRQVRIVAPSVGIVVLSCIFSFYLFPALRDEEFSKRWFPGKFYRGPVNEPAAFWFTFATLVIIRLILTAVWWRVVWWYPD